MIIYTFLLLFVLESLKCWNKPKVSSATGKERKAKREVTSKVIYDATNP